MTAIATTPLESFNAKIQSGIAHSAAVRSVAYSYPTRGEQIAFMAGYRASAKYADNMDGHIAKYAKGRTEIQRDAFEDGWILAACVH